MPEQRSNLSLTNLLKTRRSGNIAVFVLAVSALLFGLSTGAQAVTICDGACPPLGGTPGSSDDMVFDFTSNIQAEDGKAVHISATGNIYIFGDLITFLCECFLGLGDSTLEVMKLFVGAEHWKHNPQVSLSTGP